MPEIVRTAYVPVAVNIYEDGSMKVNTGDDGRPGSWRWSFFPDNDGGDWGYDPEAESAAEAYVCGLLAEPENISVGFGAETTQFVDAALQMYHTLREGDGGIDPLTSAEAEAKMREHFHGKLLVFETPGFQTAAEEQAYLQGMADMDGWTCYTDPITPEQMELMTSICEKPKTEQK